MSTLTPNHGLKVPESTDDIETVREDYAYNLGKIDEDMGGGSGSSGHTIVNPNGTDMPAENKLQFTGGVTVTDDSTNGKTVVDVSGSSVVELTQAEYEALPDGKLSDDILYGLKDVKSFLDPDILYLGDCYSTSERVIGCWYNGKPLYQKTYTGVNITISGANTWYDTGISAGDIEELIGGEMQDKYNYQFFPVAVAFGSSHTKILVSCPMGNREVENLTIRYTKSTDAPGSGTWTPSGVNAVHYDTNEQVIGTWENGKPLYQQTIIFDTGNVASNIDFNISTYMPVNSVVRDSSFTLDFTFNGDTYHGTNWGGAYVEINGVSYLSFNIGSAVYNKHVELTIKYTKTTD